MTVEEFLALPDDPDLDRELIRGELREQETTVRSRNHTRTESRIVAILERHMEDVGVPSEVNSGEVGVILDTMRSAVGVDVAVIPASVVREQDDTTRLIRGVPLIAVEILSESDTVGAVQDKVDLYIEAGVKLVWVADPRQRCVAAHVAGRPVRVYSGDDLIDAEPALEGFSIRVRKLFER